MTSPISSAALTSISEAARRAALTASALENLPDSASDMAQIALLEKLAGQLHMMQLTFAKARSEEVA